jgi:predicted ester cyclase
MAMPVIAIERFTEGKIAENWSNFDDLSMMQQLGLVPEPEQVQA